MSEHGTTGSYDYDKCRCEPCRKANAAHHKKMRAARVAQPKDPNDPRHGSKAFYSNHGCRCEPCSAAHMASCRAEYVTRIASGTKDDPTDPRHGKWSFYAQWGCRCEACKVAATTYQSNRNSKKRAAA